METQIEHKSVKLAQCEMHYVEASPTKNQPLKTLVFLHGFPEAWFAWTKQIAHFSESYRVIVPDLPGYNLSEKVAPVSFYEVPNLIAVMKDFIEVVSDQDKVVLVAHDWGGAIAWPLAAFHAQLFCRLIVLNAAHPSTFTREIIHNEEQRKKSDYIHELIADDAVDNLQQDDFSYLQRTIWESMSSSKLSQTDKEQYIAAWRQKDALSCMLKYYKAMPQIAPSINATEEDVLAVTEKMTIPNIRINVPTLILWGVLDQAFVVDVLTGLEDYVPKLTIHRFDDATHWLHHEIPEKVNKAIADWLKTSVA